MLKRFFKAVGLIVVFGISVCSLYIANLFLMKHLSIDHYLGKNLIVGLVDSPEAMTYLGLFDGINWLTKHNSRLSIPEVDDLEEDIKDSKKSLKMLNKYSDKSLTSNQKITKSIALFDIENGLKEMEKFPYHDFPLNQIGGIHLNTIEFMSDMHPVRNISEAEDFIKRTNLIKDVYAGVLGGLELQAEAGIYPPEFVFDHVIKQLNEFIDYDTEDHPLYTQFIKKVDELDISSNKSNDSDIEEDLYEGYQSYIIENEQYFKNIKNKDAKITDKFSFKTYIDKLSVSSQKAFNENTKKKNPIFLTWLPLSHSYEHTVQFIQIIVGAKVYYAESL